MMSVSGHVARPGNYEVTMGTPLLELINDLAGGVPGGRSIKAVIPGGSSVPVLPADKCDCNVDFESLQSAGSMLGSGGCIVMDETTDMVWSTVRLLKFYEHESCGKCTPCRDGTGWLSRIFDRILDGGGNTEDLELVLDICDNIEGNTVASPVTFSVFRASITSNSWTRLSSISSSLKTATRANPSTSEARTSMSLRST